MNSNYDNIPDEEIKPPKRMPITEHDKIAIDLDKKRREPK